MPLVFRRLFDVVDDECIYRAFGRFQFQSELLFKRRKERWSSVGLCLLIVGRPFEVDVVVANEAGFVDHGAAQRIRQDERQLVDPRSLNCDLVATPACAEWLLPLRPLLQLRAAFRDDELVDRLDPALVVDAELEPIGQESLQHPIAQPLALLGGELLHRRGGIVAGRGFDIEYC